MAAQSLLNLLRRRLTPVGYCDENLGLPPQYLTTVPPTLQLGPFLTCDDKQNHRLPRLTPMLLHREPQTFEEALYVGFRRVPVWAELPQEPEVAV